MVTAIAVAWIEVGELYRGGNVVGSPRLHDPEDRGDEIGPEGVAQDGRARDPLFVADHARELDRVRQAAEREEVVPIRVHRV